ncbi:MAG: His/Gly/Thr/Pro-type tRNA ligase C-terminal domain-containing protein, partial [Flavobacteriales bacterium]
DDRQVPYVLVLGSDEVEADTCTLRDMRSGEQVTEPLDQVMDRLGS